MNYSTDILNSISMAGIVGVDFEMWQGILKHVPATALSRVQIMFTDYPSSVKTLTDIYKKRISAFVDNNKEMLDKTFTEEDNFIKSLMSSS